MFTLIFKHFSPDENFVIRLANRLPDGQTDSTQKLDIKDVISYSGSRQGI